MDTTPKVGMVILYDFLWSDENERNLIEGDADRHCLVLTCKHDEVTGNHKVRLLGVTHRDPKQGETGVRIPPDTAKEIGVDHRSWIKTHETNVVDWPKDGLPFGVVERDDGQFVVGWMKNHTGVEAYRQFCENYESKKVQEIPRDENRKKQAFEARFEALKNRYRNAPHQAPDGQGDGDKPRGGQRQ